MHEARPNREEVATVATDPLPRDSVPTRCVQMEDLASSGGLRRFTKNRERMSVTPRQSHHTLHAGTRADGLVKGITQRVSSKRT